MTTDNYRYETGGRFCIDDYDEMPGFCSFLPGIAGRDGVPLWCMYVNRGQGVVSFGIEDKDHAIMEFLPATWAYQLVGTQGFRTFCKVDGHYYEPFQRDAASHHYEISRSMEIEADHLRVEEQNDSLGLRFEISYFTPVNQPVPSLVRHVHVTNTTDVVRQLSILDGMPIILPAGFDDIGVKKFRHINEAYVWVRRIADAVPFYAPKVQTHDEAEVVEVKIGHFYAAWQETGEGLDPIEPLVDPHVIFGGASDLVTPRRFIEKTELERNAQVWENRLPCALVPVNRQLAPGESVDLWALAGGAPNERMARDFISLVESADTFHRWREESDCLTNEITKPAFMASANPLLDAYTKQNYLDNVLRGGIPAKLPSKDGGALLHLYARRHGDLERDYNHFVLTPNPLSDGAGNYRDICQNRRHDCWFYPDVLDAEIRMFLNLLQADGYNPLGITGYRWVLPENVSAISLCPEASEEAQEAFQSILARPFAPGELLAWADTYAVNLDDRQAWLDGILAQCDTNLVAGGHEGGYWVDHWIYIADMLDAYVGIWPDRVEAMLTQKPDIGWFDEGAYVVPRSEKYVLRPSGPLQLDAVVDGPPALTPLPPVTPLAKMCALLAVKAVSLDYAGVGIEMEAGRPGWNDSMNGLPGLFGSSSCETAASARLAEWLLRELPSIPETEFPLEVADFIEAVIEEIAQSRYDWDRAATLREAFRKRLREGVSGEMRSLSTQQLATLLKGVEQRMRTGVEAAIDAATGLAHTYFMAAPKDMTVLSDQNGNKPSETGASPRIEVKAFEQTPLPLFLEGQVHHLRLLENDADAARKVAEAVRRSGIYDAELSMYKVCECLDAMPKEIGRARTFSRGWFENESIWTHMLYKYLIELVRCGLYDEFFQDAQTMLVPFMDPAVYGRSTLENCSFIACSDCPDPNARGRGFIARLSGSTAEFIHLWILLAIGPRPFRIENGELRFELHPVLPGNWFTETPQRVTWNGEDIEIPENALACAFLGDILLVYHNPNRGDTFGTQPVRPVRYSVDGQKPVAGASLDADSAECIRQRECRRIDVWME